MAQTADKNRKELKSMINYVDTFIKDSKAVVELFECLSNVRAYSVDDSVAEDFIKLWSNGVGNDPFDKLFEEESDPAYKSSIITELMRYEGFKWLMTNKNSDGLDGDLGFAFLIIMSCIPARPEIKIALRDFFIAPTPQNKKAFLDLLGVHRHRVARVLSAAETRLHSDKVELLQ